MYLHFFFLGLYRPRHQITSVKEMTRVLAPSIILITTVDHVHNFINRAQFEMSYHVGKGSDEKEQDEEELLSMMQNVCALCGGFKRMRD